MTHKAILAVFALDVAILTNGGPGTVHAPRAFAAFQELAKQ